MLGLDAKVVRKGSASCHVSPLSDAGTMSTTRTPAGGGGGDGGGGEGGELREEAEDHAQGAGGLGDREDAEPGQHAGRHLCGRLSAPEAALGQAVDEKDCAEGEAEDEERDVAEVVERDEESHGGLRD